MCRVINRLERMISPEDGAAPAARSPLQSYKVGRFQSREVTIYCFGAVKTKSDANAIGFYIFSKSGCRRGTPCPRSALQSLQLRRGDCELYLFFFFFFGKASDSQNARKLETHNITLVGVCPGLS